MALGKLWGFVTKLFKAGSIKDYAKSPKCYLGTMLIVGGLGMLKGTPVKDYGVRIMGWLEWTQRVTPANNSNLDYAIGILLIAVGIYFFCQGARSLTVGTLPVIRHLGMEKPVVDTLEADIPVGWRDGNRVHIIELDQTPFYSNGRMRDPARALTVQEAFIESFHSSLPKTTETMGLVYAGLAPIPLLFLMGTAVSNRQGCRVMDFDRNRGKWHALEEQDDRATLTIDQHPGAEVSEVALAISTTYEIKNEQIRSVLGEEIPIVHARLAGIKIDSLNSQSAQERNARVFRDILNSLCERCPRIAKVHLFLASQASFAFQLGRQFSPNIHGRMLVYAYSKGSSPCYNWAVDIQAGRPASISTVPSAVS